tara:strand:- start:38 stop:958 length:921 start_codon:yes stop_codon:yes gene_type:complete
MSEKIIFMGTPNFSIPTLERLIQSNYKLLCVYSQPPKKSSRGQKINKSPVNLYAERLNLTIRTPNNLNSEEEFNYFKKLSPDVVVVVAYGQIIPEKFLKLPKKGFINVHASLLPRWRGAAPIQRSIINSDKETGISIMKIVKELDSGPVMSQFKIKLNEKITSEELTNQLSNLGSKLLMESLKLLFNNKEIFIEQDHSKATYAKKISKQEAKILWNDSAKNILSKINGLSPYPGAIFEFKNIKYKILKAEISEKEGNIASVLDEELIVGCGEKSIKVLEIQKQGKNKMKINEFLLGNKFLKGSILK